jgi:dihydrofolate synthase/folylpolyglutamate synthase
MRIAFDKGPDLANKCRPLCRIAQHALTCHGLTIFYLSPSRKVLSDPMASSSFFASWDALCAHLDSLGLFRIKPGLERVHAGIHRLGLDRLSLHTVHIVGTNGKGSTAAFLHALAVAHGRSTGVFTSPHFVTPRERIRIGGEMLSREAWVDLANAVYEACPEIDFSYFELLTLIAVLAFAREGVELAILEAGLGGRWDATSAFAHDLTLITPIGLDHEAVLGPTVEAIAADKAGAIQGGVVISAPQQEGIETILHARAAEKQARFMYLSEDMITHPQDTFFTGAHEEIPDITSVRLGLAGDFQRTNALIALHGWSVFTRLKGWPFSALKCMQGLACARHPGRMEIIPGNPTFLLDGAHNLMGLEALAHALKRMDFCPETMIFSCMGDKNLLENLPLVTGLCPGPIMVPAIPDNHRAMDPQRLAAMLGTRAFACANMQEAIHRIGTTDTRVLVCGSLYLLGEFFRIRPEALGC